MAAQWIELGFGEENDVVAKLPGGTWTLIRDNDAASVGASSCWYASNLDQEPAEAAYEADGGTVSYSTVVKV